MFKKLMIIMTVLSFVAVAVFAPLYCVYGIEVLFTLAITFGTIFYHFGARLLVGWLFSLFMKNKADYTKRWYKVYGWEIKLYRFLRVNKWKGGLPTYDPDSFSLEKHSLDDIVQVMCQAELVHEVNVVLSFLPIIATIWFGSFWAFFITSVCGALFDLIFVMAQRYNRQRLVNILLKRKKLQAARSEAANK